MSRRTGASAHCAGRRAGVDRIQHRHRAWRRRPAPIVPSSVANLLVSTMVPFFTDWKVRLLAAGSKSQEMIEAGLLRQRWRCAGRQARKPTTTHARTAACQQRAVRTSLIMAGVSFFPKRMSATGKAESAVMLRQVANLSKSGTLRVRRGFQPPMARADPDGPPARELSEADADDQGSDRSRKRR